jgi:hypothetical protein
MARLALLATKKLLCRRVEGLPPRLLIISGQCFSGTLKALSRSALV